MTEAQTALVPSRVTPRTVTAAPLTTSRTSSRRRSHRRRARLGRRRRSRLLQRLRRSRRDALLRQAQRRVRPARPAPGRRLTRFLPARAGLRATRRGARAERQPVAAHRLADRVDPRRLQQPGRDRLQLAVRRVRQQRQGASRSRRSTTSPQPPPPSSRPCQRSCPTSAEDSFTSAAKTISELAVEASSLCSTCASADAQSLVNAVTALTEASPRRTTASATTSPDVDDRRPPRRRAKPVRPAARHRSPSLPTAPVSHRVRRSTSHRSPTR